MQISHESQPQIMVRILAGMIQNRNPGMSIARAKELAVAAVVGAIATREPLVKS